MLGVNFFDREICMKCLVFGFLLAAMSTFVVGSSLSYAQPERIRADDPRVAEFPEFAAIGEMWLVDNLLLSGVGPKEMTNKQANQFCEKLDREKDCLGFCSTGKARIPSMKEWQRIGSAMTIGNQFDPKLIPNMKGREFWSDDLLGNAFDWDYTTFLGSSGKIGRINGHDDYNICAFYGCVPGVNLWVRCVIDLSSR